MMGHATNAAVQAGGMRRGGVPRDVAAGLCLLLIAVGSWFATSDLSMHDGGQVGPGLVPRGVALLLAGFGVLITALGVIDRRGRIERGGWRGLIFVLGAVVLFAACIRTVGLAVAGPIAVLVSAMANKDQRLGEIIPYAVALTAICVGLFKFVLRLPVPLAPPLLGY